MSMATFRRYIVEGDRAVRLHPDVHQIEYDVAASDMIASILHAVFDVPGRTLAYDSESPEELLERALRCYNGDQEERRG